MADPVFINVTDATVFESASDTPFAEFLVFLTEPAATDVTVQYHTIDDTAGEDEDYIGVQGTLTILAGQTSGVIRVEIQDRDSLMEPDEGFQLRVFNPTGAVFVDYRVELLTTGTILDDDHPINDPSLFVSDPVLVEGAAGVKNAVFSIRLSRPAGQAITLAYSTQDGSAVAGEDYTATAGNVTFQPGEIAKTVEVPIFADTAKEVTENFNLVVIPTAAIGNGFSDSSGTARILDDDAGTGAVPVLSVSDGLAVEATLLRSFVEFRVTLSSPAAAPVTIGYQTLPETAEASIDYLSKSGTLTIAAGESSGFIQVEINNNDVLAEFDENFTLRVFNPQGAVFAGDAAWLEANATIIDNDTVGEERALFVGDATIVEGDAGQKLAIFPVLLSQPHTFQINLAFTTQDGSAVAGQDYVATSGITALLAGELETAITVPILGDLDAEGNETFSLVLTPTAAIANGAADAVGTGTILDNESPPELSVAAVTASHSEGDSGTKAFAFQVARMGPLDAVTTVDFAVSGSGGNPADAQDFAGGVLPTGTVTFNPMESFKTVVINVAGDTLEENDEGFSVTLSNPTNGVIGTAAASGTIFNDDATVPVGQSVGGTLGPDVQVGGPGNDDLLGSPGPDVLDGASGTDRANYAFSPAGVTADLVNAVGYGPGDAAGDTYISIENVRGSDFVDILIGTVGNDVLEGMGGDDILIGSLGADVLSGGDGRETFAISSVSEGGDIIADFNPAINEVIDLRTLFTAHGLPTGDPVGQGILAVAPLFGLHSVVNLDLDGAAGPSLPFTLYTLVNVAPTALDFDIHFAW